MACSKKELTLLTLIIKMVGIQKYICRNLPSLLTRNCMIYEEWGWYIVVLYINKYWTKYDHFLPLVFIEHFLKTEKIIKKSFYDKLVLQLNYKCLVLIIYQMFHQITFCIEIEICFHKYYIVWKRMRKFWIENFAS